MSYPDATKDLNLEIAHLEPLYQSTSLKQQDDALAPVDVVREIYQRIRRENESSIWTFLVPEEQALARAQALSSMDQDQLPLYGIPFSVKDTHFTETV